MPSGSPTTLPYADTAYSVFAGCSPVAGSCRTCYAAQRAAGRDAHRMIGLRSIRHQDLVLGPREGRKGLSRFTGEVHFLPNGLCRATLKQFLKSGICAWNDRSDTFADCTVGQLAAQLALMYVRQDVKFLVCTRHLRVGLLRHLSAMDPQRIQESVGEALRNAVGANHRRKVVCAAGRPRAMTPGNIALGFSAEDGAAFASRFPSALVMAALLQAPLFLAASPLREAYTVPPEIIRALKWAHIMSDTVTHSSTAPEDVRLFAAQFSSHGVPVMIGAIGSMPHHLFQAPRYEP